MQPLNKNSLSKINVNIKKTLLNKLSKIFKEQISGGMYKKNIEIFGNIIFQPFKNCANDTAKDGIIKG